MTYLQTIQAKTYEGVRVGVKLFRMNTSFLNDSVMNKLSRLSEGLEASGTTNRRNTRGGCGLMSCGGACEGLSTPVI